MQDLTPEMREQFERDGYLIIPQFAPKEIFDRLLAVTEYEVARREPPIEFEAALGYPGAPASPDGPGGGTIRRLKQAITRHPAYLEWASYPPLVALLREIFGEEVVLPLAHHNCVMVKDPVYSSDTGWHQDIRYWRYERPELISVQLALNPLKGDSGGMRLIPGTHRQTFSASQLDAELFLDESHPDNQPLMEKVIRTDLQPGDTLIFHGRTFHAADRNRSGEFRRSLIFTYRPTSNRAVPGTRSASFPELLLPG